MADIPFPFDPNVPPEKNVLLPLAIQNIVEFFEKGRPPTETDSAYTKAAYKLYEAATKKPRATNEELGKMFQELNKIPLSYFEMRSLYG